MPAPNHKHILAVALAMLGRDSPLLLMGIPPAGGATRCAVFTEAEAAADWAAATNAQEFNIYFLPASAPGIGATKPRKADITESNWLWVDIDPLPNETPAQCKQRAVDTLNSHRPPSMPAPSLVIDSGNGIQAFWRLSSPLTPERTEEANKTLAALFGGDSSWNCDRVMRLAGTVNYPGAAKRAAGRTIAGSGILKLSQSACGMPDMAPWRAWSQLPEWAAELAADGKKPDDRYPSRSEAVFAVLCACARAGVAQSDACAMVASPDFGISESIRERRDPDAEAVRQVDHAYRAAPDGGETEAGDNGPKAAEMLEALNAKFCVVENVGGKCMVVQDTTDPETGTPEIVLQSFTDFNKRFSHLAAPTEKKQKLGNWWLANPGRRQAERMALMPEGAPPGVLNLWRGWGVEPTQGNGHASLLEHVSKVICQHDSAAEARLIAWLAACVQRPWEPAGIAVVLRGEIGTGKSMLGEHISRLFGPHAFTVSDPRHLCGNFNSHLATTVFLTAEEAYWAGDPRATAVLKSMITAPYLQIERKGVDVAQVKNRLHIFMTSNARWVVPASAHERRFFVLDVSSEQRQNHAYFGAIADDLRGGGYGDLLGWLLSQDANSAVIHAHTIGGRAHLEQITASLPDAEAWAYMRLRNGVPMAICNNAWPQEVEASALYQEYITHTRLTNRRVVISRPEFDSMIATEWPGAARDGRRWVLPQLLEVRKAWAERYRVHAEQAFDL